MNWGDALKFGEETLKTAGIDSARIDARILLAHAVDKDISTILAFPERALKERGDYLKYIEKRSNFTPVSHIIGSREFWSLNFQVSSDVLDPRPDSETLVEAALKLFSDRHQEKIEIIDFGTGSGCLLLSCLHEFKNATGVGVDLSAAALNIARANAQALDLTNRCDFILSNWDEKIDQKFDLILSNPPYIPSHEMKTLSRDVLEHEPHMALEGGIDGLTPYRHLIPAAAQRLLKNGGYMIVEFGYQQADEVAHIFQESGFIDIKMHPDLSGIIRSISAKYLYIT